jgi:hypothetical protein
VKNEGWDRALRHDVTPVRETASRDC